MLAAIRKLVVQVDEIRIEMGRPVDPPTRRALAMAVIANPFAGRYDENLEELITIGEELGGLLGARCVAALGIPPERAESYGKAAVVGEAGELEHAAAILHPRMGASLRRAVSRGAARVPSAKKRGGLGTAIDVPLGHKDAAFVRSHFDAIEARIGDAPRASEILVAVAVTERIGILTARHARELGQADRVILGTDGPAGSGVPPLGMLRLIALLSSMADIPGVSMVLIDGVVRCHRSRNTPPAVEVPVLVG